MIRRAIKGFVFIIIYLFAIFQITDNPPENLVSIPLFLAVVYVMFGGFLSKLINMGREKATYEKYMKKMSKLGIFDIDEISGHDFEYWCAGLLEKMGYRDVRVTRGSGDQGVDILASNGKLTYAIQCKRSKKNIGNKAIQEVYAGREYYGKDIALVITNSYYTNSARELAGTIGVELWDRDMLICLLEQFK